MLDLATPQQLDLLNNFAKRWREATGSELLLLSMEGEVVISSNGTLALGGPEILKQVSSHEARFFTHSQQNILATPLTQGNQTFGYLVALNAKEHDASLLTWGAENIVARLIDAQALQNMTDELIGAWDQLELIYRVTQNLALTSDLMAALRSILQEIRKVVDTEDGFILLRHAKSLSSVTCRQDRDEMVYNETLLDNLVKANRVVVCNNSTACQQIWPQAPNSVDNLLATPMVVIEQDAQAAIGFIKEKSGSI